MTQQRHYYIHDLEVYPNIFTFCGKFRGMTEYQLFEISDRKNDVQALWTFLSYLKSLGVEMVGFNNLGYDYPIIHEFFTNPHTFTYEKAFQISQKIIMSFKGKGIKRIGWQNRVIPQIDIMKYCHFDNVAKATSLKALQFAMRSESLEDLPFDIRPLNNQEKDKLCSYNLHDVIETEKFFNKTEHAVDMRREYVEDGILYGDVLNFSDVKIGAEYLINRIGKYKCYAGGKARQTFRTRIEFRSIILNKIKFRTDVFDNVLTWFKSQHYDVHIPKAPRPKLEAHLAGLDFHFGIGGVHASADNKVFHSTSDYQIIDIDVAGMYPSVAIANKFAPEHLGETFVEAYAQVKRDRAKYPKGSPRNMALKLAGNGTYGNSNNPYSPFYDPQFTFSITINGQLQILQLVEMVDLLPDTELIQGNTDGITLRIRKDLIPLLKMWCSVWEQETGLILEEVLYNRMWIRDVNNYVAETMDGKLKRKGAYWYPTNEKEYDGWWNKDFSNHASIIAAEYYMKDGLPIEQGIRLVTDPFDFMLRYKCPKGSNLFIADQEQLKTVRYFVSTNGGAMKKVSPPKGEAGQFKRKTKITDEYFNKVMEEIGKDVWDERIHTKNKSKYETRVIGVQSGWKVTECNHVSRFDWSSVDYEYYIQEAKKLIIGE